MDQVSQNLKDKSIVYKKSIDLLKNYITTKYPEAGEGVRAQIFADAIHKIIDDHIKEFSRSRQRQIKKDLLVKATSRDEFELNCYDVMKTCVALGIDEEAFTEELTSWVNRTQEIPVYRDQVISMTQDIKEEIQREEVERQAMAIAATAKNNQEANDEASERINNVELLEQLEEAFQYQPVFDGVEPELYSQGAVNEAYEQELRKDRRVSKQHVEMAYIDEVVDEPALMDAIEKDDVLSLVNNLEEDDELALIDTVDLMDESYIIEDEDEPALIDTLEDIEEPALIDTLEYEDESPLIDTIEDETEPALIDTIEDEEERAFVDPVEDESILDDFYKDDEERELMNSMGFNLFNIANVLYDDQDEPTSDIEDEPTSGIELEDDRPIIKVAAQRQVDQMDTLPKVGVTPDEESVETPGLIEGIKETLGTVTRVQWLLAGLFTIVLAMAVIAIALWLNNQPGLEEPQDESNGESSYYMDDYPDQALGVTANSYRQLLDEFFSDVLVEDKKLSWEISYKEIDEEALRGWLYDKNALLGEEPYFTTILDTAKDYGINPLLLFAIAGQEQAYVPKDHEKAMEIINNPYNVYGSWQEYNTTLEDSAAIAAITILRQGLRQPDDVDSLIWLNERYAEDEMWHVGVRQILLELEDVTDTTRVDS